MECAALCQSNLDCSAFVFEGGSQGSGSLCELGIKSMGTTSADTQLTIQIFLAVYRSGLKIFTFYCYNFLIKNGNNEKYGQ